VHLRGWLHWRRLRRTAAVAFADARTDARTDAGTHTFADTITDELSNCEPHAASNSHTHPVPYSGTMHVNIQLRLQGRPCGLRLVHRELSRLLLLCFAKW
jgi:hypothetical protein